MKHTRLLASAALAAILLGCATNPMTGRSQVMLVSEDSVIAQARQAYTAELQPWSSKGRLNTDASLKARVDGITNRLIAQAIRYRPETAKWDWQVAVIDDPKTLNAFCLPGGRMAIYTGLIEKLKATDDEIAQVMGHEIGHALANHGAEKMSRAMVAQGVVAVATVAAGSKHDETVALGGTALAQLGWLLPNSREAETEADRIGIELAARAGYDPKAGPTLWRKMQQATGDKGRFDWLSTHPASERRTEYLASLVPLMQPIYTEARAHPPTGYTRLAGDAGAYTGSKLNSGQAGGLRPLTLASTAVEQFRQGDARLTCAGCASQFQARRDSLRRFYRDKAWENLAREVLETNFKQDIAWFYLGAAAQGLGQTEAAREYYERAVKQAGKPDTHCQDTDPELCHGIRLPEAASEALRRLPGR